MGPCSITANGGMMIGYILLGLAVAFTAVAMGFAIDSRAELRRQRREVNRLLSLIREEQAAYKDELLHHVGQLAAKAKRTPEEALAMVEARRAARGS